MTFQPSPSRPSFRPSFTDDAPALWATPLPNGSIPPSSSITASGSPHPNRNSSWTLQEQEVARLETAHESLLSVPDGQSPVQAPTYASEQEELDAIRARIRRAPFMTSIPQCKEPSVGSSDDLYTGGRGITGKSIFTAFIKVLASGEYQCNQCGLTYKKLDRAIGDQARHFGFKSYICEQKHDGKTVCGKAFGMKDYMEMHQERENAPSVQCPFCPALIKHERNLPRHMQQVHGHSSSPSTPAKRHRFIGKEALYATMRK